MSSIIHYKKRWLEESDPSSKRVKLSPTTLQDLDPFLLARIASFLTLIEQGTLSLVSKHWHKAVILGQARELGYKGKDPQEARERIQLLCLRIQIFQEQTLKTGFGQALRGAFQPNTDTLTPPFFFSRNAEKKRLIFQPPLPLLFEDCKNFDLKQICSWFLLNPSYYMTPETPWIDFFEVESSWSREEDSEKPYAVQELFHALSYAFYFQRTPLIQILLRKGAPVGMMPGWRRYHHPIDNNRHLPTPLESAIEHGDQKLIELLITKGAKIRSSDLRFASLPLLKVLLPRCEKPINFTPSLNQAIWIESQETIELLFQHGCPLEPRQALLMMSSFMMRRIEQQQGCSDPFAQFLLTLLLDKGADLNENCPHYPLLHEAVSKKSLEWTAWLLDHGAQINQNVEGTPLYYAMCNIPEGARSSHEIALIQLLLSRGANPLGENPEDSPYSFAQEIEAHEIVALFDEHLNKLN